MIRTLLVGALLLAAPVLAQAQGAGYPLKADDGTLIQNKKIKPDVVKEAEKLPGAIIAANPQGDVTLVEFFDYNCGFCKKAYLDKFELMRTDGRLRVVLKELPILGPGSVEAAQVAVAVRMQDPGGEKYVAFHRAMMGAAGQANKASALAAARGAGLDMDRLERDLANPETKASIDESRMLANSLGITATPSFVVGDSVTTGAAGISKLAEKIAAARR